MARKAGAAEGEEVLEDGHTYKNETIRPRDVVQAAVDRLAKAMAEYEMAKHFCSDPNDVHAAKVEMRRARVAYGHTVVMLKLR